MNRGDIRAKDEQEKNKGFNLNESMNFNYWGIQEYTSLLKKSQFRLSSNIGYYDFTERANRFYTSILPADSLLGVKYLLLTEPIKGLESDLPFGISNGKKVYKNPYALPMAFIYRENDQIIPGESDNPFTYTNALYSKLIGHAVTIYHPVSFTEICENRHEIYEINNGVDPIYAFLIWDGPYRQVSINGESSLTDRCR